MFCKKCGRQLNDNDEFCPACGEPVTSMYQTTAESVEPTDVKEHKFFHAPSKGSKSFAAIFSALLVFPATICIAIDLSFSITDYWCGYVVGALMVLWVCVVFPVLRVTPPVVTAVVCAASIISYVCYVAGKTGHLEWLYKIALPLFIMTVVFISVDVAFFGAGLVKGLHIVSLLSAEAALYFIGLEMTIDTWIFNAINLRWSLILSCGFISVIAILEACSYIGRIKK